MTSIGYVDVWRDGEITVHGRAYSVVDPDSSMLRSHCAVCGWSPCRSPSVCDETIVELS